MTLRAFLEVFIYAKKFSQMDTVICFVGKEYPLLFFNHLFAFLKKHGITISRLDCNLIDISSTKALLATANFTGQTTYWLENFCMLSSKKQQELLLYLHDYSGPHRVILFSREMIANDQRAFPKIKPIIISQEIAVHECGIIWSLISEQSSGKNDFIQNTALHAATLPLDTACLLTHYQIVLGKNMSEFFSLWVTRIIEPSNSLFLLSQYLFAKKQKLFFLQWAKMYLLYPSTFWSNFWADQIWRAYVFCDLMKQKRYTDAKKSGYKLPFSFINRDWSLYTLTELQNAHQLLYHADFGMKNSRSDIVIDYFYAQFFDGKLKK